MENLCYSSSNLPSISSFFFSFFFFFFFFSISNCNSSSPSSLLEGNAIIAPKKAFPALFILGESLADTGNNNYILTLARVNSDPYGIDFPQGPTDRFTNGKTTLDIVAELNNMPYPLPYLAPNNKGDALLVGVIYASSTAGILELYGFNFKLYHFGGRRIVVGNIGPLGCIPSLKASHGSVNGECLAEVNYAITLYNQGLKVLIHELNFEFFGSKFIFVDNFPTVLDFHDNPTKHGFKVGVVACCGIGKYKGQSPCLPIFRPCNNQDDYVFFDAFHPTEKANTFLAHQIHDEVDNFFLGL